MSSDGSDEFEEVISGLGAEDKETLRKRKREGGLTSIAVADLMDMFGDDAAYSRFSEWAFNFKKRQKKDHPPKTPAKTNDASCPSYPRPDIMIEYRPGISTDDPAKLLDEKLTELVDASKNSSSDSTVEAYDVPAPFLCLIQSTGYGKTKAILELAKSYKWKIVYILCKEMPNGWKVPAVFSELLEQIKDNDDQLFLHDKWSKFLDAVTGCVKDYPDAKSLYEAQIITEGEDKGKLGPFFEKLYTVWKKITTPKKALKSSLMRTEQDAGDRKTVSFDFNVVNLTGDNVVLCLDEVTALSESQYKAFRRMAKHKNVISMYADTATSVCSLINSNDHSGTRFGSNIGPFLPPIYQLMTQDKFWNQSGSNEDYLNLFQAGRPLWGGLVETAREQNPQVSDDQLIDQLVNLATSLLNRNNYLSTSEGNMLRVGNDEKHVEPLKVAQFTCRFSMGELSKISSVLAKHCLGTITFVSSDRKRVGIDYPSEPILAEASARCTRKNDRMNEVLSNVEKSFGAEQALLEPPRGDLGEMCAAALLGYTMDSIRKNDLNETNMSTPVPLFDFLRRFGCTELNKENIKDITNGWSINFTHFFTPSWTATKPDLHMMWKRRLAYYVRVGAPGLDLLIPINNDNGEIASFRVQVKNYPQRKIYKDERSTILYKLQPKHCEPTMEHESLSIGMLITSGTVDTGCSLYNSEDMNTDIWAGQRRSMRLKSKRDGGDGGW
eukprot:CAMPEP_0113445976 /NCGR_PEP_ID=MMETSP0014_2-20120614/3464_1 /TAXON_ID=2857 /ORGANISM="Nitzschia sp." /LENGTH=721 /DNA_ID=CAMNT_0000337045 /DNA_START=314 /DNA_END=2476 /DNA_ORIENTATION=+ /assembly_acc=CAM_ASM_000159